MNRKTIWLLCAVLLIVGCGRSQSVKFNETARKEADTAENEAVAAYTRAVESISLDNRYGVELATTMGDWKTNKAKFAAAAEDYDTARVKFALASTKMREAMNGQASFDNKRAAFLGRSSEAFKLWSEMAEFERKTCQDWSEAKDPKAIQDNLDVVLKARKKMNDEVTSMIRSARSV
jgi:hypothetical protein